MKTKLLIVGIGFAMATSLMAATNDLSGLLQKGLFEEEANRNLNAASAAYESLVKQLDKDRQIGATAIFRLGEVYRKQGKTNEAAAQYERIVRDFAEQTALVTLSRQNLAGMGKKPETATTTPSLSRAARLEKKQLLEQEIKLVEQELENVRIRISAGVASPEGALAKEREVLQLRRQLAELDVETEKSTATVTTVVDEEEAEIRRIQAMIQNSPDLINARGEGANGDLTPLAQAAGKGQLRVAEYLLNNGADVNLTFQGWPPLGYAAQNGHKKMVELLIARGASIDAKAGSRTALHIAVTRNFPVVVESLLAAKADPNSRDNGDITPLMAAVLQGSVPMAKALLARGADVNLVNKFPVQSGRGGPNVSSDRSNYGSALHLAAARDNMAMMQLLLTNRADVALRNIFGETALHVAAASGRTDVVALLVVAGADVNATGAEDQTGGATPLHLAIVGGYREVAKLLLESGANPNTTIVAGSPGRTPLIQAAFGKDAELIALLLNYKANPNAIDTQGYFALLNAVLARNAKTTRVLLAGGANPDMLTTDGYPLLKLAVTDSASKEVVQELIEAKANVNASDPNGWTPLHWAASGNRKELVELLVKAGADVNLRDKQGKTPLDYVKGNNQPVGSIVWKQSPRPGMTTPVSSPVSAGEAKLTPDDMALLLRQHGALDELPDFTRIRITRQGLVQPHVVFVQGTTTTNRFTLLETLMRFYKIDSVYWETKGALAKASAALQFPDFGRIIIHRPSPKLSGKEQEIKISLLDGAGALDCAKDVAVAFGDVIEVPERVHALNAALDDPVNEMEAKFGNAKRVADEIRASTNAGLSKDHPTMVQFAKQKADADAAVENVACLRKSVQLVIAGKATPLLVDSWKEGFLSQALTKMEARSALRSSSDLSRTQVKRKDAKTGKQVVLIVDARDVNDSLWLHEGDVIEVPDKP